MKTLPSSFPGYHSSTKESAPAEQRAANQVPVTLSTVGVGLGAKPPRGQQTALTRVPQRTAPAWHIRSVLSSGAAPPRATLAAHCNTGLAMAAPRADDDYDYLFKGVLP